MFKYISNRIFVFSFLIFSLGLFTPLAMAGPANQNMGQGDPYAATAYRLAFDQRALWAEFSEILVCEGLGNLLQAPGVHDRDIENFLSSTSAQTNCVQRAWSKVQNLCSMAPNPMSYCNSPEPTAGIALEEKTSEALNLHLMKHFTSCKRSDALAASKEKCGAFCAEFCCLAPLIPLSVLCPVLSMGGGFSTFVIGQSANMTMTSTYLDWQKIQRYQNIDPWLTYELYYAKKKRAIAPSLWKEIEEKFSLARSNPYLQESVIKFLDIALNLPTKKTPLGDWSELEQGIYEGIERFFIDYEGDERCKNAVRAFKIALKKQVEASTAIAPSPDNYRRLIYLQSPGGLGKTRFVGELATILYGADGKSKLIAIDLAGGSVQSFFGTKNEPGSLLERLVRTPESSVGHDAGRQRYTNELLFMDEAAIALNTPSFVEEFKRLSEPSNGQFSPAYLPGVNIPMKDYLIIAAGNKPIEDAALRSRFIVVDFPKFRRDFLCEYLLKRLQRKGCMEIPQRHKDEVEALLLREDLTIRDIEQEFDNFLE